MKLKLTILALLTACFAFSVSTAEAQEIYVPNYGDGTVSVINTASNSVTHTIPIPGASCGLTTCPEDVALSADGLYAFVSLDTSDQVPVIDTTTHAVVNQITVTPRADALLVRGPTGTLSGDRLYVGSWSGWSTGETCPIVDTSTQAWDDNRRISVIDISNPLTATEIATIPVDHGVFPITISPDGLYAYAVGCNPGWNTLHKIDLTTNTVVGRTSLSRQSFDVQVSTTSPVAYVTGSECVLVVDLVSFLEDEAAAICTLSATTGVQFNAAGTRAYVLDAGAVTLVTLDTTVPLLPAVLAGGTAPVTSLGVPIELAPMGAGTTLYVIASQEAYGVLPSEVIEFDISGDLPVQGCSATVGNGGFRLGVLGAVGPWECPPPPGSLPTTVDQCKKGGWKTYGVFRNQGDCLAFVATLGKNPPGVGKKP